MSDHRRVPFSVLEHYCMECYAWTQWNIIMAIEGEYRKTHERMLEERNSVVLSMLWTWLLNILYDYSYLNIHTQREEQKHIRTLWRKIICFKWWQAVYSVD